MEKWAGHEAGARVRLGWGTGGCRAGGALAREGEGGGGGAWEGRPLATSPRTTWHTHTPCGPRTPLPWPHRLGGGLHPSRPVCKTGHSSTRGPGMQAAPRTQSRVMGVGQGCTQSVPTGRGWRSCPVGIRQAGGVARTPTHLPPSRLLQSTVLSP